MLAIASRIRVPIRERGQSINRLGPLGNCGRGCRLINKDSLVGRACWQRQRLCLINKSACWRALGGHCAIPALGGGAFTATAGRCATTFVACGAIAETVGRCSNTIAGCVAITATGSRCSIPTAAAAPFPAAFRAPLPGAAAAPLPDAAPSPQLWSTRADAPLPTAVASFPAAATHALLASGGPTRAPRLPSSESAY